MGLGDHHSKAFGQGAVQGEGVRTALERLGGKLERGRERSLSVSGAVAIDARAVVDLFTALKCPLIEITDESSVIDEALIVRQGSLGIEGWVWLQLARTGAASVAQIDQVADQV